MSWHQLPKEPQSRCNRETFERRVLSLPKTRLGWYSLGFSGAHAVAMVALGIASGVLAATGAPNLASYPWLIGVVLFVALSPALAGIATGLIAVIRRGERSILVLAPILLVVLFLLAEVLLPH